MLRVKEHTPTACCLPRMATNTSCTMIKRPFLSSLTLPEFRITLRASSYVYCTASCPCCVKPLTSRVFQSPPEIRMDVFKHRCRLKAKGALKHPLLSRNTRPTGTRNQLLDLLEVVSKLKPVPHPFSYRSTLQSVESHRITVDCHRPEPSRSI